MSEYIDCLIDLYNEEKNNDGSKNCIKTVEKLLKFYGIETE